MKKTLAWAVVDKKTGEIARIDGLLALEEVRSTARLLALGIEKGRYKGQYTVKRVQITEVK